MPAVIVSNIPSHNGNTRTGVSCGQKSYGLSSVAEQNRQRRILQQGSYELSSLDENNKHFGKHAEDDEAKLWSPGIKNGSVKAHKKSRDPEISSMETLELTVVKGVNKTTVTAEPSNRVQGAGIQVQHETVVDYNKL